MASIKQAIKNNNLTKLTELKTTDCSVAMMAFEDKFNDFCVEDKFDFGLKLLNWINLNNTNYKGAWYNNCNVLLRKKEYFIKEKNYLYLDLCSQLNVDKEFPAFVSKLKNWKEGWDYFTNKVFDKLPPKIQNKYIKFSIVLLEDKNNLKYFNEERIQHILKNEGLGWVKQTCSPTDQEMLDFLKYIETLNYSITFNTNTILSLATPEYNESTKYLISKTNQEEKEKLKLDLDNKKYSNIKSYLLSLILNEELLVNNQTRKKIKI